MSVRLLLRRRHRLLRLLRPVQPRMFISLLSLVHLFSSRITRFFQNKGAVAGVFTVVGLAVVVLIVVLATNAVRRRRARKFDADVQAAAEEAARSPRYPFDDYLDDPDAGGAAAGYAAAAGLGRTSGGTRAYSDVESHGTYNQPPMSHYNGESYNMSEFPGGTAATYGDLNRQRSTRDAAPSEYSGAGIAGFGASGGQGNFGSGQTPYNAFAGPGGGYGLPEIGRAHV